jgi:hypothetical protein
MNVARSVERFLEQAVDRLGRVFPSSLEPVALATRLIREAELATRRTDLGPVAPNHFTVGLHPDDLPGDALPVPVLERAMAASLEEAAAERGWRLEGPMEVRLNHHDTAASGAPEVAVSHSQGPRPPWGSLAITGRTFSLTNNRLVVGRSAEADVTLGHDTVSRRHALIWRTDGEMWVKDLGSANGTTVDGTGVAGPTRLQQGSVVAFGGVSARLEVT